VEGETRLGSAVKMNVWAWDPNQSSWECRKQAD